MEKTTVRFEVTVPTDDNKLLNDAISMIARMKYLLNRIPTATSDYAVFDVEKVLE